jgi:hypothetical protein
MILPGFLFSLLINWQRQSEPGTLVSGQYPVLDTDRLLTCAARMSLQTAALSCDPFRDFWFS